MICNDIPDYPWLHSGIESHKQLQNNNYQLCPTRMRVEENEKDIFDMYDYDDGCRVVIMR